MASASTTRERSFEGVAVTPQGILDAAPETVRAVGLSRQKTRYVRNAAQTVRDEDYSHERLTRIADRAVTDELTHIIGVGTWTTKTFLLFVLAREDVFPVEDPGIRTVMARLYSVNTDDRTAMVKRAADWRPCRSCASLCLWRASN